MQNSTSGRKPRTSDLGLEGYKILPLLKDLGLILQCVDICDPSENICLGILYGTSQQMLHALKICM